MSQVFRTVLVLQLFNGREAGVFMRCTAIRKESVETNQAIGTYQAKQATTKEGKEFTTIQVKESFGTNQSKKSVERKGSGMIQIPADNTVALDMQKAALARENMVADHFTPAMFSAKYPSDSGITEPSDSVNPPTGTANGLAVELDDTEARAVEESQESQPIGSQGGIEERPRNTTPFLPQTERIQGFLQTKPSLPSIPENKIAIAEPEEKIQALESWIVRRINDISNIVRHINQAQEDSRRSEEALVNVLRDQGIIDVRLVGNVRHFFPGPNNNSRCPPAICPASLLEKGSSFLQTGSNFLNSVWTKGKAFVQTNIDEKLTTNFVSKKRKMTEYTTKKVKESTAIQLKESFGTNQSKESVERKGDGMVRIPADNTVALDMQEAAPARENMVADPFTPAMFSAKYPSDSSMIESTDSVNPPTGTTNGLAVEVHNEIGDGMTSSRTTSATGIRSVEEIPDSQPIESRGGIIEQRLRNTIPSLPQTERRHGFLQRFQRSKELGEYSDMQQDEGSGYDRKNRDPPRKATTVRPFKLLARVAELENDNRRLSNQYKSLSANLEDLRITHNNLLRQIEDIGLFDHSSRQRSLLQTKMSTSYTQSDQGTRDRSTSVTDGKASFLEETAATIPTKMTAKDNDGTTTPAEERDAMTTSTKTSPGFRKTSESTSSSLLERGSTLLEKGSSFLQTGSNLLNSFWTKGKAFVQPNIDKKLTTKVGSSLSDDA